MTGVQTCALPISRLSNPNLEVVDRILEEWFSHQLRDVEAVKAYEAEKAARYGANRSGKARTTAEGGAKARNIGNFQQRDYSDDFLNGFYEDVAAAGDSIPVSDQSVEDWPEQLGFADLKPVSDSRHADMPIQKGG